MNGKPVEKTRSERHAAANEPQRGPKQPPRGPNRNNLNWKSLLGLAVALFLAWQVIHVVTQSHNKNTSAGRGPAPTSSSAPTPAPTPTPTVTIGGHRVAATAGPSIVLNPGLVAPGGQVGVDGSGFTPKTSVVVWLRSAHSSKGTIVAHGKAAKDGTFIATFSMPVYGGGNGGSVVAQDSSDGKTATANLITAGGVATAKINGKAAGKPGQHVSVSATGFGPGETVNVYWGRVSGTPAATITANPAGGINPTSIPVGVAPVGNTTLVLIGARSHTTATVPYLMLGLYPSTVMHPYAIRAGHGVSMTGTGFAPGEQVLIYLNSSNGVPALTATAGGNGNISVNFSVPFGLKGKQSLLAIGNESRASTRSGFTVLPYMPSAQASTYGALPGTTVSFYAKGFAANEVVLVYSDGKLVTAFRVNSQGSASAQGSYIVPSGVANAVIFKLVGQQSGGDAAVKLTIEPGGSNNVPAQPQYVLPPSLGGKPTSSPSPSSSGKSAKPAAPSSGH